jgi:hypothetical protein
MEKKGKQSKSLNLPASSHQLVPGHKYWLLASIHWGCSRYPVHIRSGMEMVLKMLVSLGHSTQLMAQKDLIELMLDIIKIYDTKLGASVYFLITLVTKYQDQL